MTVEQDRDYQAEFRSLLDQMDQEPTGPSDPMAPPEMPALSPAGQSETAKSLNQSGLFDSLEAQHKAEREQEEEKGVLGSFYDAIKSSVKSVFDTDEVRGYARDMLMGPLVAGIEAAKAAPEVVQESQKASTRGLLNVTGSAVSGAGLMAGDVGATSIGDRLDAGAQSVFDVTKLDVLQPRVEALGKIRSENWFRDTTNYIASKVGEGTGSSLPFFALGPTVGLPGAFAFGYTSSVGEIRQELEEAGVTDPAMVSKYSYIAAVPHAALDQLTEIGLLSGLTKQAKREVTKHIVRTVLKTGGVEAGTEATQRVIEIGAVAHALGGDSPNAAVLAALSADLEKGVDSTILESGISGFFPGTVFGGVEAAGNRAALSDAAERGRGLLTEGSGKNVQEARNRASSRPDVEPVPTSEEGSVRPGKKSRVIDLDSFGGPLDPVEVQLEANQPDREVPGPDIQTGADGEVAARVVPRGPSAARTVTDQDVEAYAKSESYRPEKARSQLEALNQYTEARDMDWFMDGGDIVIRDREGNEYRSSAAARTDGRTFGDYAERIADDEDRGRYENNPGIRNALDLELSEMGADVRVREDLTDAAQPDFVDQIAGAVAPDQAAVNQTEQMPPEVEQAVEAVAQVPGVQSIATAVDQIASVAAKEIAAPAEAETSDSAYKRLLTVLAGKTNRNGWAKATKVSEQTLQGLLARAEKDGLVRRDRDGGFRRNKDIRQAVKALRRQGKGDRTSVAPIQPKAPPISEASPSLSIPSDMRVERRIIARERRLRRALPPYVTDYAYDVDRALGTDGFDAVIARLAADDMIRKTEMHELAGLIGKKVPKSATKKAALQTIIDRHNDAIDARASVPEETDADSDAVLEDAGAILEDGISELLQSIGEVGQAGGPSGGDRAGSGIDVGGDVLPDAGPSPRGNVGTDAVSGEPAADAAGDGTAGSDTGPTEVVSDEIRAQAAAKVEADKVAADQKRRDRSTLNYQITDDDKIGQGGPKAKIRANIAAIKVLRTLEDEERGPTEDEKKTLVKYTGWGAFSQKMFDEYDASFKKEREEFRSLVSEEEYKAARTSTLNAHYTSPEVVNAMWSALEYLGFKGGRVIEPASGSGNFIGLTPAHLRESVDWTAVELDKLTGGIAKALYQAADVRVQGYQDAKFPDNFFDVAISNVPFADIKPYDPVYKGRFNLHDFFFLKSLDKVRPGGVVAFITSSGTLDKKNAAARREMAKRANLVGAIRLPGGSQGAFKGNAGTDVTTDILFFRKRIEGEKDLSSIMVEIDYTNSDGEQETARFAADKALGMVERRINGLRELLGCLS